MYEAFIYEDCEISNKRMCDCSCKVPCSVEALKEEVFITKKRFRKQMVPNMFSAKRLRTQFQGDT